MNEKMITKIRRPRFTKSRMGLFIVTALAMALISQPTVLVRTRATSAAGFGVTQTDKWAMKSSRAATITTGRQTLKGDPLLIKSATPKSARDAGGSVARTRGTRTADEFLVLNVEFISAAARQSFKQPGATVITGVDRFADMFVVSNAAKKAVLERPDVVWAEFGPTVEVPPPPKLRAAPPTRQIPETIVRGGISGLTGRGVILAVIDTGLDFRNPDFITYDAKGRPTSRLLYLWDTTSNVFDSQKLGSKAPFSYPNGASIGTLYTRAQLTAELRARAQRIPPADMNGHGTACAGIAAGSGNNDKKEKGLNRRETVGVAPDADIIGIRIDQGDDSDGLENSYLTNAALDWLDRVAAVRPLVVSCSFGGHRGGHDGQLITERQINARFPLTKPGRAIVIAAGNEGNDGFHAEATFRGKANAKLVTWNSTGESYLRVYFDTNDSQIGYAPAGQTELTYVGGSINPFTKQLSATVKVPDGEGGMWLFTDSGRQTHAHLYLGGDATFAPDVVAYNTLVGNPGTATNAITVGSYDWNDVFDYQDKRSSLFDVCEGKELTIGGLSCYSSPGYARNGTVKPEVTAPGEWFTASYAKNLEGTGVGEWTVDKTGRYVAMNGTSSATPYTAGIIALMLQKKPALTVGEIRRLLTTNASRDPFTGPVPNPKWGYGKLNLPAVQKILAALN